MNLEGIASPPLRQRPEIRYATLHRSIERGLAGERAWAELVTVCAELGRFEEAAAALRRVKDPSLRRHSAKRANAHGMRLDTATPTGRSGYATTVKVDNSKMPVMEHLGEAIRFLFVDHMPLTLIVTTVMFPVVIGLGGLLRASLGPSAQLIAAFLTAIPALTVLALIGHLTRQTVRDGRRGLIDPPDIPRAAELPKGAFDFGRDALAVTACYSAPAAIAFAFGSVGLGVLFSIYGLLSLPLALALRMSEDNWNCLNPLHLFQTVRGHLISFAGATGCAALLFAPALVTMLLTRESSLDLCLSLTGSLATVPMILASRLFGQVLQERDRRERHEIAQKVAAAREAIDDDDEVDVDVKVEESLPKRRKIRRRKTEPVDAKSKQTLRERSPSREHLASDEPRRRAAAKASAKTPATASAKAPSKTPAKAAAKATAQRPTAEKRQPVSARPAETASRPQTKAGLDDQPDLRGIPGATIVRRR